jgi:gamma-glutamyl-gamma-aminobutyrate hydrolase PuuD
MKSNAVVLVADSLTGSILGTSTQGRCHHHQAIDRLGDGLRAVGFATDGTVEALEAEGKSFAVGVQWHPEDDPRDDRLFRALVDAAARRRPVPRWRV